jgi:hypothetical protein
MGRGIDAIGVGGFGITRDALVRYITMAGAATGEICVETRSLS